MFYSVDDKQKFYDDLDEICGALHDGPYVGFNYDGVRRRIEMRVKSYVKKTEYSIIMDGVKLLLSTGLNAWSICDTNIVSVDPVEYGDIFCSLLNLDAVKGVVSDEKDILELKSKLKSNVENSIGIRFFSSTGNEATVLCESMEIICEK